MNFFRLLILAFAVFMACNNSEPTVEDVNEVESMPTQSPELTEITITEKPPGTDFPAATITKWAYTNGRFDYDYDAAQYKLGVQSPDAGSTSCANSDKGQHIHLIVDNQPYIAKYEPDFEHDISDGVHHILTFLSRSYHESIKTDAAHKAEMVDVQNGSFAKRSDITQPMLFYSRPKGTYTGKDTEKVLLDFYPVNAPLGSDYQVKVAVGNAAFMVNKWAPYYLEGLPMGENTVTLTLLDGQGKMVDAPLNPVSRTFVLAADPME